MLECFYIKYGPKYNKNTTAVIDWIIMQDSNAVDALVRQIIRRCQRVAAFEQRTVPAGYSVPMLWQGFLDDSQDAIMDPTLPLNLNGRVGLCNLTRCIAEINAADLTVTHGELVTWKDPPLEEAQIPMFLNNPRRAVPLLFHLTYGNAAENACVLSDNEQRAIDHLSERERAGLAAFLCQDREYNDATNSNDFSTSTTGHRITVTNQCTVDDPSRVAALVHRYITLCDFERRLPGHLRQHVDSLWQGFAQDGFKNIEVM